MNIYRPTTVGELKDKLEEGVSCEVAEHVSGSTYINLRGWLDYDDFTIDPSDNPGWVTFNPLCH